MATEQIADYESQPDTPTIYRARGLMAGAGGTIAGDWSTSTAPVSWLITYNTTTCEGAMAWLKNPLAPAQNRLVRLGAESLTSKTRRVSRGVFGVLGRGRPVAVTDVRASIETELKIITKTTVEAVAVRALFNAASTLLLQCPAAFGWDSAYVSPGDLIEAHVVAPAIQHADRLFTVPVTVTDAPVGAPAAGAPPP